jgi:hypothetical protein
MKGYFSESTLQTVVPVRLIFLQLDIHHFNRETSLVRQITLAIYFLNRHVTGSLISQSRVKLDSPFLPDGLSLRPRLQASFS